MGCSCALPFAAQTALLRERLERGLGLLVAWGLKAGLLLLEEGQTEGPPTLSRWAVALLTAAGAGLVHVNGPVTVLLFPVLLLAWVARMVLGAYQAFNIVVDLGLGAAILLFLVLEDRFRRLFAPSPSPLRARLQAAESYAEYRRLCAEVDREEGTLGWREDEKDLPQAVLLRRTVEELEAALKAGNLPQLRFLLGGVFRRNHLGVDAANLHTRCLSGPKLLLERYQDKLKECLRFIAASPDMSKAEKEAFLRSARRSLGRTALCLSGGGSMAMYHLGIVRSLIETGVFRHIKVITGASGGSILAALLAIKTEEELLKEVLTEDFSTDFKGGGRMQAEKIEWFFTLRRFPIARLLLHKGVLDKAAFERTVAFYVGDWTFAEAFARTGRHVTISVSHSSLAGYRGAEELLLNHLTTPNVLIRSAVVASCSLPGILKPSHLLSKNTEGVVGPFYLNGVQWIDGSIQADIPLRGVSTMFCASNFIVSQVNFHVVLGLRMPGAGDEDGAYGGGGGGAGASGGPSGGASGGGLFKHKRRYWSLFKMLATDIKYRAISMRQLGLFPTFFGQDISGVFQQTYSGQVTIIPPFRLLDSWGTNAILTPGREGIHHYIERGRRSCWRHLGRIKHLMAIEVELARCIAAVAAGLPVPHPALQHPAPSLASATAAAGSTGAVASGGALGSQRQLSIGGASMVTDGDLEDEDEGVISPSAPAWAWGSPATAAGALDAATTAATATANAAATGSGGSDGEGEGDHGGDSTASVAAATALDDDDDLVVGEFHFVAGPSDRERASLRLSRRGAGQVPASSGMAVDSAAEGPSLADALLLSPARRARQLSAAAGETLLGALGARLAWLEQENRKLSAQLAHFLGTVEHGPGLDDACLRAAFSGEFGEEEDEDGEEQEQEQQQQEQDEGAAAAAATAAAKRVSIASIARAVAGIPERSWGTEPLGPAPPTRQRRHSTQD